MKCFALIAVSRKCNELLATVVGVITCVEFNVKAVAKRVSYKLRTLCVGNGVACFVK